LTNGDKPPNPANEGDPDEPGTRQHEDRSNRDDGDGRNRWPAQRTKDQGYGAEDRSDPAQDPGTWLAQTLFAEDGDSDPDRNDCQPDHAKRDGG